MSTPPTEMRASVEAAADAKRGAKREETKSDVKFVTSLLILALLALSAFLSVGGDGARLWARAPDSGDTLDQITGAVFGKFVFAFELLSALLLAGLVGAVVIGLREKEGA